MYHSFDQIETYPAASVAYELDVDQYTMKINENIDKTSNSMSERILLPLY